MVAVAAKKSRDRLAGKGGVGTITAGLDHQVSEAEGFGRVSEQRRGGVFCCHHGEFGAELADRGFDGRHNGGGDLRTGRRWPMRESCVSGFDVHVVLWESECLGGELGEHGRRAGTYLGGAALDDESGVGGE